MQGVQLYGPGGITGSDIFSQLLHDLSVSVDELVAAPFYVPGSVEVVNGEPVITYRSRWGLRSDGTAYYDPDGAAAGEEAILSVEDGALKLTRLETT